MNRRTKVLLGLLIVVSAFSIATKLYADAGDRSTEWILNRSYDSTNTALKAVISGNAADLGDISCDTLTVSQDEANVVPFRVISMDATTSLMVNARGNVGVGTTAPLGLLDVNRKFNVLTGGNIGIGVTNPLRQVSIYNSSAVSLQLLTSSTGVTTNDGLLLQESGLNANLENSEAGSLTLRTNAATRIFISSDGSVGIGTTTPVVKLQTIGDISGDTVRLKTNNASPDVATILGACLAVSKDITGAINLNFYDGVGWRKVTLE